MSTAIIKGCRSNKVSITTNDGICDVYLHILILYRAVKLGSQEGTQLFQVLTGREDIIGDEIHTQVGLVCIFEYTFYVGYLVEPHTPTHTDYILDVTLLLL